jgi:hypothetical protein
VSEIPADMLTAKEVFDWYECTEELAKLKVREALLRARVFRHLVPVPKEGVNTIALAESPIFAGVDTQGYVLKADHKINRSVDEASLVVLQPKFQEALIVTDKLIKRKPELVIGEYRKLTAEQQQLFDQALIVKPGTPQLDIVLPVRKGKK